RRRHPCRPRCPRGLVGEARLQGRRERVVARPPAGREAKDDLLMARILIADQLSSEGVEMLRERHEVDFRPGLTEDELVEAVTGASALLVRSQAQVTARVIEAGTNLVVIGRAGVGVDNIDVDAATQRGIIVVNAPLANTISTAEHTFALLLAVARSVPQGHASLKEGRWERSRLAGVELRGSTLGI